MKEIDIDEQKNRNGGFSLYGPPHVAIQPQQR